MATFYVDNTLHPAANAVGTAGGGGADYLLVADAGFQQDDVFGAYGISITSGTGAGQQRRIIGYDYAGHANGERCATVDSAWTVPPSAGSTYEITVGCDSNTGTSPGTGTTGAWRTIDRSAGAISGAGAGPHWIHIKGGRAYCETVIIRTLAVTGQGVVVQGYAGAPGDGGLVCVDGGSSRSSGVASAVSGSASYAFRNLRVTNCTGNGFDLGSVHSCRFVNCLAENNGGNGFTLGQDHVLLECRATGNAGHGFSCSSSTVGTLLVACHGRGNGNQQFKGGWMVMVFCTASAVASNKHAVAAPSVLDSAYLINCTIDGAGSTGADGCYVSGGSRQVVINTIFTNLNRGLQATSNDPLRLSRNNLFFNCVDGDAVNWQTEGGDVRADPMYVDLAQGDLRVTVGSPGLRAGYPAHVDIGAMQHCSRNMLGGPCGLGMQA